MKLKLTIDCESTYALDLLSTFPKDNIWEVCRWLGVSKVHLSLREMWLSSWNARLFP